MTRSQRLQVSVPVVSVEVECVGSRIVVRGPIGASGLPLCVRSPVVVAVSPTGGNRDPAHVEIAGRL